MNISFKFGLILSFSLYLLAHLGAEDPQPLNSVRLGEKLFFDSILSEDYSLSCASCHRPEFAFADTSALSKGVHGRLGTRNTPSAMNVGDRDFLFWDSRATSLEEQALGPIVNPVEMNLALDVAVARLRAHEDYRRAFLQVYQAEPSEALLAKALADYQRSLETSSAYDAFMAGDTGAISAAAKRGLTLFNEKAKCFDCHFGPDMTGDELRSIGLFDGIKHLDPGRFAITGDSADLAKFKTPGLRNVAITAPYFHDGSFASLAEVLAYYNNPQAMLPLGLNRDSLLAQPLDLTEAELEDIEAFLYTLTAPRYYHLLTEKQKHLAFGQEK